MWLCCKEGGRRESLLPQYLACTLRSRSNGVDATIMTSHHHSKFLPQRAAEMHKAAREQIRPMRYGCQLVTGVWRGYVCTWLSPKARGSYGTPNTLILCVFMYECVMLMARRRRRALAPRARRAVRGVYSCTVEYCTKRVCPVYTVQSLCAYILNACALWQHLTLSGHDTR